MIQPTVGRVVWFYPSGKTQVDAGLQPLAATVAHVHNERCINIGYLNAIGEARNATSVRLIQEGDDRPADDAFCEWMPYQKGQAAKAEAAEKTAADLGAEVRRLGLTGP